MKWNRSIAVVTVALLLICGSAWAQEAIKVGVVGPRTGPAAATALAESMALPPPTLTRLSAPSSRKRSIARSTLA